MQYLGRLLSITISYSLVVAILERAFTLFARLYVSTLQRKKQKLDPTITSTALPAESVKPINDFDYKAVAPIKYRPFENKRHVTMGG